MSGVPQGSHLNPILFVIHVCSIFEDVELVLFADDIKLYKSISTIHDAYLLQNNRHALFEWCICNDII